MSRQASTDYIENREFPDLALRVIHAGFAMAEVLHNVHKQLAVSERLGAIIAAASMAVGNEELRP